MDAMASLRANLILFGYGFTAPRFGCPLFENKRSYDLREGKVKNNEWEYHRGGAGMRYKIYKWQSGFTSHAEIISEHDTYPAPDEFRALVRKH